MFPRKVVPARLVPAWEAFSAQAERIQRAREALQSCVPVGRAARAPAPVGVELMRDELDAIRPRMTAWRVEEVAEEWERCAEATDRARARCDRALEIVGDTDDGHVLLREVAAIVMPLETWLEAEQRWRELRVRPSRRAR